MYSSIRKRRKQEKSKEKKIYVQEQKIFFHIQIRSVTDVRYIYNRKTCCVNASVQIKIDAFSSQIVTLKSVQKKQSNFTLCSDEMIKKFQLSQAQLRIDLINFLKIMMHIFGWDM